VLSFVRRSAVINEARHRHFPDRHHSFAFLLRAFNLPKGENFRGRWRSHAPTIKGLR
jgi:hypothetical protein